MPRPWFYYGPVLLRQSWPWELLLPLAGLLALFLLSWLLVISVAQTKLEWYTDPMLPPLALGLGAAHAWARGRWLAGSWAARHPALLAGALAVGLVAGPHGLAIRRIVLDRRDALVLGGLSRYNGCLGGCRAPQRPAQLLVYYPITYYGGLQFDQEVQARRGLAVARCGPDSLPAGLPAGRRVLMCLPRLRQRYRVRLLDQRPACELYGVRGPARP